MIFYVNKSFYTTWLFSLGINLLSKRYDIAEKKNKADLMHLNIESKHSCDVFVQRLTTISLGFNNKALNDNTVYIYMYLYNALLILEGGHHSSSECISIMYMLYY